MLEQVEWGEFKLGDLFNISTTKSFDEGKLNLQKNNKNLIEFIGRTKDNNGIKGYIEKIKGIEPNIENTISISQIGTIIAQLRKNQWYSSQNIFQLIPKNGNEKLISLYCLSSINTSLNGNYSSGYSNYPTLQKLKELIISLPVKKSGEIDFEFMDNYIRFLEAERIEELEAERIEELEAYLFTTGLKNYELTNEELRVLKDFEEGKIEWREFNIIDIFNVKNSGNILSRDIIENSGDIPYLCASSENNGVSSYITYNEKYLDKGNCVFIGGKTFVVTYQEKDFYSNDSHNLILYLKNENYKTKLNQLYLICCVIKGLGHKYTWGNSISNKKIQSDKINLPTKNGQINFEFMETFISAIQKIVIKDVVLYADEKIKATREVVNIR